MSDDHPTFWEIMRFVPTTIRTHGRPIHRFAWRLHTLATELGVHPNHRIVRAFVRFACKGERPRYRQDGIVR